jgi:hypothetical protein
MDASRSDTKSSKEIAEMGRECFSYKSVEEDLDGAMAHICSDLDKLGLAPPPGLGTEQIDFFNSVWAQAMHRVVYAYLAKGIIDPLITYLIRHWNAGGGDEYLLPISRKLVELKDSKRLLVLWKGVIASRRDCGSPDTVSAIYNLMGALQEIGDQDNFRLAEKELLRQSDFGPEDSDLMHLDMSEENFWDLIQKAKEASLVKEERTANLVQLLAHYDADSIKKFAAMFEKMMAKSYSNDLWGVAYIVMGGCGDDDFEGFRSWLISEGHDSFCRVVNDPDALADIVDRSDDPQLESFQYAAYRAHERKHGRLKMKHTRKAKLTGREWTEPTLSTRFPMTYAKFSSA